MGAPKFSSAMRTTSMARTTPAQNPRGFRSRTRFSEAEEALRSVALGVSIVMAVTLLLYRDNGFAPAMFPVDQWGARGPRASRTFDSSRATMDTIPRQLRPNAH